MQKISAGKFHDIRSLKCWRHNISFRLDARSFDNRPPFFGLGLVEGMKRFRGLLVAWEYLLADVGKPLANRRVGECGDYRGIELYHDLLRCAFGHPQPVPERNVDPRHA